MMENQEVKSAGVWPCSHIIFENYHYWYLRHGLKDGCLVDEFNYCPICGAKRPEKPKELWEVIREESLKDTPVSEPWEHFYKRLARAAEEFYRGGK